MVVHRLGMDTSGLIIFALTLDAVRGMHALFRSRRITRQYGALVCGHVPNDQGMINLPLMRCYLRPPFMRISTDEHQRNLVDLDPNLVGKLLEAPKASLTHYNVESRQYIQGSDFAVTKLTLTSISGRTHQLNVHCAAFGHPIVRDTVYGHGYQAQAAPHGGLDPAQRISTDPASDELIDRINEAAKDRNMCVHAKLVRFKHPITKERMEFTSPTPF
jgi:tRNA pseudouridine32 synthase/23S rRNA pseudouridine746 synthase